MSKYGEVQFPVMDFRKLKIRFLAEKKFGKTSFLETIDNYYRENVNDFAVFTLSIGGEGGSSASYGMVHRIETFERLPNVEDHDDHSFIGFIDDLVENPDDYPSIIAIDTENELTRLAEPYIISQYNRGKDASKKSAKSINTAYGGHHSGQFAVANAIKEQLSRISGVGKGIITCGHTKRKEKKDKTAEGGEVQYEQVTSNLMSTYDNPFSEFADINMIGYYSYNENDDDEIESVDRKISLSSRDDVSIGSGSRFLGMISSLKWDTFNDDTIVEEQYKINNKNGYAIINAIKDALVSNAKAKGIVSTDSIDSLVKKEVKPTVVEPKPRKKRTAKPKDDKPKDTKKPKAEEVVVEVGAKENSNEMLKGDKLWAKVVVKIKEDASIKGKIIKMLGVSQAKEVKPKFIDNKISRANLIKINKLVE